MALRDDSRAKLLYDTWRAFRGLDATTPLTDEETRYVLENEASILEMAGAARDVAVEGGLPLQVNTKPVSWKLEWVPYDTAGKEVRGNRAVVRSKR